MLGCACRREDNRKWNAGKTHTTTSWRTFWSPIMFQTACARLSMVFLLGQYVLQQASKYFLTKACEA